MAITATLVRRTKFSLAYLLAQDGAAGTTLNISAATLAADASGGGPIQELMRVRNAAGNVASQAEARDLLMAFNQLAVVGPALPIRARAKLTPLNSDGVINWFADANLDVDRAQMEVATEDGAAGTSAQALLEITVQHSIDQ